MPAYNGVFAAVNVDSKPLDEYDVQENDAQKEVSCWISSQVGKEFTISYRNPSLDKHMALFVFIDGHRAACIHIPPGRQGTVSAFDISATEERPFLFSEGRLVDDDDMRGELQNLDSLGTMKLSFHEGYVKSTKQPNCGSNFGAAIPEQRLIPERGKKGIQTCVALGPVKIKNPAKRVDFTYTKNVTHMIFRYRPLNYLQAQGIAPLPPPPPQPRPASPRPQRATAPATTVGKIKRKRTDHAESSAGPSDTKRRRIKQEKLADIEISDDEDVEKLQALRARIDRALSKKNVRVKKEIKTEPKAGLLKGEVLDLT